MQEGGVERAASPLFFAFLIGMTLAYLAAVELAKRRFDGSSDLG